jgi:predicted DNA-binding transcriptional regulator AlpA
MSETTERFYTQEELAQLWKMSWATLRKWRWEGKGPQYVKLGSRVLYRESDIMAYARENITRSTSETRKTPC